jgi:hypothetical protein
LAQALAPFAPGSQSRMSVARIVRVQSSSAPPPREHAPTLPTSPPAWTSATIIPPAPARDERPRLRKSVALVALGASSAALLAFALWLSSDRGEPSRIVDRAKASSGETLAAPAAPSPPFSPPRSAPSPRLEPTGSARPIPSRASVSPSPQPVAPRKSEARPPAGAGSMAPSSTSVLATETRVTPLAEAHATPLAQTHVTPLAQTHVTPLAPGASAAVRPVRPLDTENPFAPSSK